MPHAIFRRFLSVLFIFLAGFSVPIHGQTFEPDQLEQFIEDTMSASTTPGLAISLFDASGVYYEKAFGVIDTNGAPTTIDTPFQLGSISKSYAALLVMQLVETDQLDLDDPVVRYVPYFRTADIDASNQITVRQILSHQSGLSTLDGNRLQQTTYRGTDALERAIRTLSRAELNPEPIKNWAYSNANYMLVAAVVENITEQPFETVARTRIFEPLGLSESYVQMRDGTGQIESMGFLQWFGVPVGQRVIPGRAMMGAGGVTASAKDLGVYVQAVASADPRIMSPTTAEALISTQWQSPNDPFGYALGWMTSETDGKKVVFHGGLNGGFAAHAAFFPEEGRGAVVVTNQSGTLQADVPGVVLREALGIPTGPTTPVTAQRLIIWLLLATVFIMAFAAIFSMVRFSKYAKHVGRVNRFRRGVPVIALFGLAYGLTWLVPPLNGITLSGIKVFYPDLWFCLITIALIAVAWGLARLIFPLRRTGQ